MHTCGINNLHPACCRLSEGFPATMLHYAASLPKGDRRHITVGCHNCQALLGTAISSRSTSQLYGLILRR
jgi:hypothetical protein